MQRKVSKYCTKFGFKCQHLSLFSSYKASDLLGAVYQFLKPQNLLKCWPAQRMRKNSLQFVELECFNHARNGLRYRTDKEPLLPTLSSQDIFALPSVYSNLHFSALVINQIIWYHITIMVLKRGSDFLNKIPRLIITLQCGVDSANNWQGHRCYLIANED